MYKDITKNSFNSYSGVFIQRIIAVYSVLSYEQERLENLSIRKEIFLIVDAFHDQRCYNDSRDRRVAVQHKTAEQTNHICWRSMKINFLISNI